MSYEIVPTGTATGPDWQYRLELSGAYTQWVAWSDALVFTKGPGNVNLQTGVMYWMHARNAYLVPFESGSIERPIATPFQLMPSGRVVSGLPDAAVMPQETNTNPDTTGYTFKPSGTAVGTGWQYRLGRASLYTNWQNWSSSFEFTADPDGGNFRTGVLYWVYARNAGLDPDEPGGTNSELVASIELTPDGKVVSATPEQTAAGAAATISLETLDSVGSRSPFVTTTSPDLFAAYQHAGSNVKIEGMTRQKAAQLIQPYITPSIERGSRMAGCFVTSKPSRTERYDAGIVPISYFGGIGDGLADDTDAIEAALNSEFPVISFPETGAFYKILRRIETCGVNYKKLLAWGARILSADLTKPMFYFENSKRISVDGGEYGYVDMPTQNGDGSQHVMQFYQCQRVLVDDIHIRNSPEMGIATTQSEGVTIQNSLIEHCFRDGTYAHYSANVRYLNNTYRQIKDDAMSFHDYGLDYQRTFIAGLGYDQASDCLAFGNLVENAYQGFSSVAGKNVKVIKNTIKNTVGAGVVLMNQSAGLPGGTKSIRNGRIESNDLHNVCATQTINGLVLQNFGQASSGRAAITIISLGDNNQITLNEVKRSTNVVIKNNTVYSSGALGLHCSSGNVINQSGNTYMDCVVTGNSLGGSVVEVWSTLNYTEESTNTIIDTRTPTQHMGGYVFSNSYGIKREWVVINRVSTDGTINGSGLIDVSGKLALPKANIDGGSSTQQPGYATYAIPHRLGKTPDGFSVQANRLQDKITGYGKDASSLIIYFSEVVTGSPIVFTYIAYVA